MGGLLLNWLAIALYLATCLVTSAAAVRSLQRKGLMATQVTWLLATVEMIAILLVRLFNLEELARNKGREWLYSDGTYALRGEFQGQVLVFMMLVCTTGAFFAFWLAKSIRGSGATRNSIIAAQVGMILFLGLFAFRLVSLHLTDQLLYAGPLRLNWVLDGGLTLLIGGAALTYLRALRNQRPSPRATR